MSKLAAMSVALFAVACGPTGTVRIDTTLAESESLARASQVGTTLEIPTISGGVLALESVRIAVSELELEGDEDEEFETGERVVDVALNRTPTEIVAQRVAAGSYRELGLELMVGGIDEFGGPDPASIVAKGSFEGGSFTYRSTVAPELEFNLAQPVEVREGAEARVAVTFDVAAWFMQNGTALDPRDPNNHAIIEQSILASMAAHADVELGDD